MALLIDKNSILSKWFEQFQSLFSSKRIVCNLILNTKMSGDLKLHEPQLRRPPKQSISLTVVSLLVLMA